MKLFAPSSISFSLPSISIKKELLILHIVPTKSIKFYYLKNIKKINSKKSAPIKLLPPLSSESNQREWLNTIDKFINRNIIFEKKPRHKIIYKFSLEENSKKWINLTECLLKEK